MTKGWLVPHDVFGAAGEEAESPTQLSSEFSCRSVSAIPPNHPEISLHSLSMKRQLLARRLIRTTDPQHAEANSA
jgi:hypothetical protein